MKKEIKQGQDFGSISQGLLKKFDQGMSSLKTLLISVISDLPESYKISGRSGMMQNGILYRLVPLVPHISVKGSGLLPTPTAVTYGSNQGGSAGRTGKKRYSLEALAKQGKLNIPTPSASDSQRGPGKIYDPKSKRQSDRTLVTYWEKALMPTLPTVTTFDSGNPLPPRKKNKSGGQKPPLVSIIGKRLNPSFVEWMMGFPVNHTNVIPEISGWTKLEEKESNS